MQRSRKIIDRRKFILICCESIGMRSEIQNYFRMRGFATMAPPKRKLPDYAFNNLIYVMIAVDMPVDHRYFVSFKRDIPIISLKDYNGDYTSSELEELLFDFCSSYRTLNVDKKLFFKEDRVMYLGYRLKLSPNERLILATLAATKCYYTNLSLREECLGNKDLSPNNVEQYISRINRKARLIGDRNIIHFDQGKGYCLAEYL